MISHVVGANVIYRRTDFDGMVGLGFVIKDAHIFTSGNAPGNPTPGQSYSSGSSFLNAVSAKFIVTHRDDQHLHHLIITFMIIVIISVVIFIVFTVIIITIMINYSTHMVIHNLPSDPLKADSTY